MVLSINIPLKESDEAVINFLLGMVFGPQRKLNSQSTRRECLKHDVLGASKLIEWILRKETKNRQSLTIACNLVYGNTIVLSSQVARLLIDAIRAREIVSYTAFVAAEEERKRKTLEQMEHGVDEDGFTTPKKKRRSKQLDRDRNLLSTPVLLSTALKQNITMPDYHRPQAEEKVVFDDDDDLAPVSLQDLQRVYGMLADSDERNTSLEKTFIDRYSSNDCRENPHNLNIDFEFERPTEEFIREQLQTPSKSYPQEEQFEPAENLQEILKFARLPIMMEEDRRKSLEEEMEDARNRGINMELDSPPRMEIPRYVSEQLDLDDDIVIPRRRLPRTPGSAVKNQKADETGLQDGTNKIPLKEMHYMMEDFSHLHYNDSHHLRKTSELSMSLKELFNLVPFAIRKKSNRTIWSLFNTKARKYHADAGNAVSDEEDEEEESRINRRPDDFLDPIDLSNLNFLQTPLKVQTPSRSPVRPHEDLQMIEEIEYPRQEPNLVLDPVSPRIEDPLLDDNWTRFKNLPNYEPIDWSTSNEESVASIREKIIRECVEASPYSFELGSMMKETTTRREASRIFYATLELLKDRNITATQKSPFDIIELHVNEDGSEDLESPMI